jgi:hypothetical protein
MKTELELIAEAYVGMHQLDEAVADHAITLMKTGNYDPSVRGSATKFKADLKKTGATSSDMTAQVAWSNHKHHHAEPQLKSNHPDPDIRSELTSGTKTGNVVYSSRLSGKPQTSNSEVTLHNKSMSLGHHPSVHKTYTFPKGTEFVQHPGGIFAKHPSVPETHKDVGTLIQSNEENIGKIHKALN